VRSIEFQKFIDLVTFDQSLVKTERDIQKFEEVEKSLAQDIQRLQDDFLDLKTTKLQARKAVDDKELYMKVVDGKEVELKDKYKSVTTQKELKSLEKETVIVNSDRLENEQELISLWNKAETLEKNYEAQQKTHDELTNKLNVEVQSLEKNKTALKIELDALLEQRLIKQENIPQEWLDMYVNMKGRVNNPVIKVVDDSCDACFYSVTARDLQVLRQNKLLQCRDCYRLLYFDSMNK